MSMRLRLRAAAYVSVIAGYLIAGPCLAMEGREVRVELTGSGTIDMSKIHGESISLYGIYIGQSQADAAKALAQHKMTYYPMSKEQMIDARMDPRYQIWTIEEPKAEIFPGLSIRLNGGVVDQISISTVPSEFSDRKKEVFYRRFSANLKALLTNYSHEAQIKSLGAPKTSSVEHPSGSDSLRRDLYPDRGISLFAYWTKNVIERYADVGIAFCRKNSSVADACK